jgi:hypothetical protein
LLVSGGRSRSTARWKPTAVASCGRLTSCNQVSIACRRKRPDERTAIQRLKAP